MEPRKETMTELGEKAEALMNAVDNELKNKNQLLRQKRILFNKNITLLEKNALRLSGATLASDKKILEKEAKRIRNEQDNLQKEMEGLNKDINKCREEGQKQSEAIRETALETTIRDQEDVKASDLIFPDKKFDIRPEEMHPVDGLERNLVDEWEELKDKVKLKMTTPLTKLHKAVEVIEELILDTSVDGTSEFARSNNMLSLVSDIKSLIENSGVVVSPMPDEENHDKMEELKSKIKSPDMMEKLEVELKEIEEKARHYIAKLDEHKKIAEFIKEDAKIKVKKVFDDLDKYNKLNEIIKTNITTGNICSAHLKNKGKNKGSSLSR